MIVLGETLFDSNPLKVTPGRVFPKRMNTYTLFHGLTSSRDQKEWSHREKAPMPSKAHDHPSLKKARGSCSCPSQRLGEEGEASNNCSLLASHTLESPRLRSRLSPASPSVWLQVTGSRVEGTELRAPCQLLILESWCENQAGSFILLLQWEWEDWNSPWFPETRKVLLVLGRCKE